MALFEGRPMSNVDAAWLHMEDPTNLMLITGVMSFYEKLDFAELKALIEDRLLPFERFRQKVVESPVPGIGPRWVEDRTFNLRSPLGSYLDPLADKALLVSIYVSLGIFGASSPEGTAAGNAL